jgi:hypothetical protein
MAYDKYKNSKSRKSYDDEEDDEYGERKTGKKKQSPRRRPVRNWKQAWNSVGDNETLDDN